MKTDTQLQQDVIAELAWEPTCNAARIGVEVKDGVVTLAGHVDSYAEKMQAQRAAQRVAGVKALAIEVDVVIPGSSQRTDADLARSAQNVIEWMAYVPKGSVMVMVESGWVTLSGECEWDYQRTALEGLVRDLMGVRGVTTLISLKTKMSSSTVKADIDAALERHAKDDAKTISVQVSGADVTLTGTVRRWSDRELARRSAWAAPGVRSVVDDLTVVD